VITKWRISSAFEIKDGNAGRGVMNLGNGGVK
jgi:hypothetical protein